MDVRLFCTPDGGNIEIVNGQVVMADSPETAVYLSLFGGNERDTGSDGDRPLQWWGNLDEPDTQRRYRSETQSLLRAIPATPANLHRIEDAVSRDLAWMLEDLATSLSIEVTMPRLSWVAIKLEVEIDGVKYPLRFEQPWST